MPIRPTTGRASLFRGKQGGMRVQGNLTKIGGQCFEQARGRLKKLYRSVIGTNPKTVSDADTIEYLARGEDDTRKEWKAS